MKIVSTNSAKPMYNSSEFITQGCIPMQGQGQLCGNWGMFVGQNLLATPVLRFC